MRLITVTSPATDAGKTFIGAGLAEAATARDLKTLFIDFDNPVGDSLRVFGVTPAQTYPTIASWREFSEPWNMTLMTDAGTHLLPKPDMLHEQISASNVQDLLKQAQEFDLVIADLGTDYRAEHWNHLVTKSDLAILVVDRDEKAIVRVKTFLATITLEKDWLLAINSREKEGYYASSQIARLLSEDIQSTVELPHYPDAERRVPKTYPPDSPYLTEILSMVFDIEKPDLSSDTPLFKLPTIKLPSFNKPKIKIPQRKKTEKPPKERKNKIESNLPVAVKKKPKPTKKRPSLFTKSGIIIDHKFVKLKFSEPEDITIDYDAVVIPASGGIHLVKKFRRKNPMIPIVVLKGNKSFIAAGADKCVPKITPSVIEEVYALISRLQELWSRVETDPLTGLYTRRFLNEWMQEREQRSRYYSAVILDLDKFKSVNDTYGHDAGDAVLAALGGFLKSETRIGDIVARYGGEEFVICLPDTTASEAHYLIDRLRQKWSQRLITIPDGRSIKTTFSAGVAEWYPGADIIKSADKMLYQAKEEGRNKVCMENRPNVLLLGIQGTDNRINITYDPKEADFVITNSRNIKFATNKYPVYCIGTGSVSDWSVKQTHPTAIMCSSFEDAVNKILAPKDLFMGEKPKLTVLPGARGGNKGITVPDNGALYVVCPSRPAQAGEVSAKLVEHDNTALVCATPESTAALSLGIPKEELIDTDWRIPGAKAPIQYGKITVWPVDPYKHLNVPVNAHSLVDQIKSRFSLVIVDCGASLDICSRIAKDEGVLVLAREGDKSDEATQHWLENYGGLNVTVFSPAEIPNILSAENGFILSKVSVAAER